VSCLRDSPRNSAASTGAEPGIERTRRGFTASWACALCVVGAVVLVWGRTVGFPFVNLDDRTQIVNNLLVTAPGTAAVLDLLMTPTHGYIVPVTAMTRAALWAVGGGQAWPFHLANLCLHALFCLGLCWLLRHEAGSLAAWLGLVLVVHPLVAEPVAWSTGIKDLLCANFVLLSTVGFVHAETTPHGRPTRTTLWLALAAITAVLAMLAKPTSVLMGGAFIAYLTARRLTGAVSHARYWRFAVGILTVGIAVGLLSRLTHDQLLVRSDTATSLGLVWQALGYQAAHLLWPRGLHPTYYLDLRVPLRDAHTYLGVLVSLAGLSALYRLRHAPRRFLALSLAVLVYLPVSNVLPFPRRLSDSYLYLPLACVLFAVAPFVQRLLVRRSAYVFVSVGALLCSGMALLSHRQAERWSSNQALWRPVLTAFPDAPGAYGSLASAHLLDGEFEEAAKLYRAAFERRYDREFVNDYGVALAQLRQNDDAECVIIEGAFHGDDPLTALRNFAIFVARAPERPLGHPAAGRFLLQLAAHSARRGRIRLDPATRARLFAQVENLAPPAEPPWPRSNCAVLRPGHRDGTLPATDAGP
jgi:protein O-mannosyl-transferase